MSDVATEPGTLWRKQLLPFGTVEHGPREITLNERYIGALASAFDGRALSYVPVLLDGGSGYASYDPALAAGEVRRLEVVSDGLDALIVLDRRASELVAADPRVGVAPGIAEDHAPADGRRFPVVLMHVMITESALITGLRPWQPVVRQP